MQDVFPHTVVAEYTIRFGSLSFVSECPIQGCIQNTPNSSTKHLLLPTIRTGFSSEGGTWEHRLEKVFCLAQGLTIVCPQSGSGQCEFGLTRRTPNSTVKPVIVTAWPDGAASGAGTAAARLTFCCLAAAAFDPQHPTHVSF